MSDAIVAIEPLEMPMASPVADVLSGIAPPPEIGSPEVPLPPPSPAERTELAPDLRSQEDGTPVYKTQLLESLLGLLARLSPTEASVLRTLDVDDAIVDARRQLLARQQFSAGLELGTGLVVNVFA